MTSLTYFRHGFSEQSTVEVGGESCEVDYYTQTTIACLIPAKTSSSPSSATVKVLHPAANLTSPTNFLYRTDLTPTVTSSNTTRTSVRGGAVVLIQGYRLKPAGMCMLFLVIFYKFQTCNAYFLACQVQNV